MKTTKVPTLAEIKNHIISCLKENTLPVEKDALHFFTLVKSWRNEPPLSLKRRQIFANVFETFKRRCVAKDEIGRKNEMWAAINAVIAAWEEHKNVILAAQNSTKRNSLNLTWINH